MDLEGVGAIASASIAAFGIPAMLLVGRWQMRGAVRTAEETGRAGLAQAEANYRAGLAQAETSYRAALDAVRAQADNTQSQWRRGLRRDAYSALLLATNQLLAALQIMNDGPVEQRISRNVISEQQAAVASMRTTIEDAALIARLEGPDEVEPFVKVLVRECVRYAALRERDALQDVARYTIRHACDTPEPDQTLTRFRDEADEAAQMVLFYEHGPDALEAELSSSDRPSSIRDARNRAMSHMMHIAPDIRDAAWAYLTDALEHPDRNHQTHNTRARAFYGARTEFMTAAKRALDHEFAGILIDP